MNDVKIEELYPADIAYSLHQRLCTFAKCMVVWENKNAHLGEPTRRSTLYEDPEPVVLVSSLHPALLIASNASISTNRGLGFIYY